MLEALQTEAAQQRVSRIAASATRAAVRESLQQLTKQTTEKQLAALTHRLASSATRGIADSLPATLGPAMTHVVQAQLMPGVTRALGTERMQRRLAEVTRSAAHDAVLGTAAGLHDAWYGYGSQTPDLRLWLWLPLALLGLLCVLAVAMAVIVTARARRARAEVARLEDATLLLATVLRERRQTAEADEIATIVQQALESSAQARRGQSILGALRLRRTS